MKKIRINPKIYYSIVVLFLLLTGFITGTLFTFEWMKTDSGTEWVQNNLETNTKTK